MPQKIDQLFDQSDVDLESLHKLPLLTNAADFLTLARFHEQESSSSESPCLMPSNMGESGLGVRDIRFVYRQALDRMLRVCILSGPMSTLVWPLHTLAFSAISDSDKTFIQDLFKKSNERQHMKVVEVASHGIPYKAVIGANG